MKSYYTRNAVEDVQVKQEIVHKLSFTEHSYIRHLLIILNVRNLQPIVRCDNTVAVFVHRKRILLERYENYSRLRWPRGLGRGFAASHLQRLRIRFPPVVVNVCCWCCVLSRMCIGLITRPEEFYWVWCLWVWSPYLSTGRSATGKKKKKKLQVQSTTVLLKM